MLIVMHIAVLQPLTSFGLMFPTRYTVTAAVVFVVAAAQITSKLWPFELDVKVVPLWLNVNSVIGCNIQIMAVCIWQYVSMIHRDIFIRHFYFIL